MLLTTGLNLDPLPLTVTASQTLAQVTQTTTVGVPAGLATAQTLATVTQTATATVRVGVTAPQTLPQVSQALFISEVAGVVAGQMLAPLTSSATAAVVDAVSAAQTLPTVTQTATIASGAVAVNVAVTQTLATVTQTLLITAPGSALPITPGISMPVTEGGGTYAEFERGGHRFADEWYKAQRRKRDGRQAKHRDPRPSGADPAAPELDRSADERSRRAVGQRDDGRKGRAARIAARLREREQAVERAGLERLEQVRAEQARQAIIDEQLRLALAARRDDEEAALLLLLA